MVARSERAARTGPGFGCDALWAPRGDRGKLLPPPYQDAARPARRAESCPSGGGAATEGTGVAASGEGGTGAARQGPRGGLGPAGGCGQYATSAPRCWQGGAQGRDRQEAPPGGIGRRAPVRPGAVKVVAESTKAGRLPEHRRPWRPSGAHGDRLGSVQRSGSPPDRRRGHDGWPAREPAPGRRRLRRGIGARPYSLAPHRA